MPKNSANLLDGGRVATAWLGVTAVTPVAVGTVPLAISVTLLATAEGCSAVQATGVGRVRTSPEQANLLGMVHLDQVRGMH